MTQQPQNQKLCLKWNNHTSNLLTVLGGFQQRDILVDVTISCQGKNIKAHKMVLSACSSYFQSIFLENPCQHPIVIINGMKYDDVLSILNFMYKGEVNVSQDGLASFLQAAESLKVKGLADMCGSNKTPNSNSQNNQQIEQNNHPSRTDTPPRRKHRNRKRSLSDSNRSEDEGPGASRPRVREPSSPEIHELSGDESFTGDNNSNGPPFNSVPRVPQNTYSHPHQQSSNLDDEEDEFDVEPTNLLEQTLTTDNVPMNEQPNSENKLRIERIVGNVGSEEMESSSLQEQPGSPPDIKPIINYGDSSAGPSSEGSMMLYNDQSQPGPSSVQDGSMLHDNSHADLKKIMKKMESFSESQKSMMEKLNSIIKCLGQQGAVGNVVNPLIMKKTGSDGTDVIISLENSLNQEGIMTDNTFDPTASLIFYDTTSKEELNAILKMLPLKDINDLGVVEKKLSEGSISKQMVEFLGKIGGESLYCGVKSMLKRLLSNKLASEFSYYGMRNKPPFNKLGVCRAIHDAAFRNSQWEDVTERNISVIIMNWLRHAKARYLQKLSQASNQITKKDFPVRVHGSPFPVAREKSTRFRKKVFEDFVTE